MLNYRKDTAYMDWGCVEVVELTEPTEEGETHAILSHDLQVTVAYGTEEECQHEISSAASRVKSLDFPS
jgi:hypothetical protein